MAVFIVFLFVVALLVLWAMSAYNALVRLQNRYENAYAQIDVQLKRRYDLIPNLVETAKGYLQHERETLEAVIAARNQAARANASAAQQPGDPGAMTRLNNAEGLLAGALGRLMMVAEDYPELKASETMSELQEELRSTENRVAFARQAYNDAVTTYNTRRETVPTNLIASNFGFNQADLFEIHHAEERRAPKVSF